MLIGYHRIWQKGYDEQERQAMSDAKLRGIGYKDPLERMKDGTKKKP